jgi:hypothetical protein
MQLSFKSSRIFNLQKVFKIQFLRQENLLLYMQKLSDSLLKFSEIFNLQTVLKQIFLSFKTAPEAKMNRKIIAFSHANLLVNN